MSLGTLFRPLALAPVLLSAALGAACGEDDPINQPTPTPPVAKNEFFDETLNPNGGRTHPFVVERAGEVQASILVLEADPKPTVGLSLGTWNGAACNIILANDNAAENQSLIGSATTPGTFCVRVYDNGRLTGNVAYRLQVIHY